MRHSQRFIAELAKFLPSPVTLRRHKCTNHNKGVGNGDGFDNRDEDKDDQDDIEEKDEKDDNYDKCCKADRAKERRTRRGRIPARRWKRKQRRRQRRHDDQGGMEENDEKSAKGWSFADFIKSFDFRPPAVHGPPDRLSAPAAEPADGWFSRSRPVAPKCSSLNKHVL